MKCNFIFFFTIFILNCGQIEKSDSIKIKSNVKKIFQIYTQPSDLKNQYPGFNSSNAINKIAEIENNYFNSIENSVSNYYGTNWAEYAKYTYNEIDTFSDYQKYRNELQLLNIYPDSLHCTLYAMQALTAGLDSNYNKLETRHIQIYKDHEHAGWSVGHILTKYFDWKAYLILSESSTEYENCVKNYKQDKKYHVWRQPNIDIEELLYFDSEEEKIDSLLLENEFGWGFSNQGWHTWITRFDVLKECNWSGAPSKKYMDYDELVLFKSTKFMEYRDYESHIIIFPPKNIEDNIQIDSN